MEPDATAERQGTTGARSVHHFWTSIKHGGTKGCTACFGLANVHSLECRARFQDVVDSEAGQTVAASAGDPTVETPGQAAGGPAPSSSSGSATAASGPEPEDVNMGAEGSSAA